MGPEIQPAEPPEIEQLAPVHFITIFYLPILPGLGADLVEPHVLLTTSFMQQKFSKFRNLWRTRYSYDGSFLVLALIERTACHEPVQEHGRNLMDETMVLITLSNSKTAATPYQCTCSVFMHALIAKWITKKFVFVGLDY